MAEYIEREALLKDISDTVVYSVNEIQNNSEIRGANKVIDRIKSAPTADVQEVVRCKNCKFWTKISNSKQGRCLLSGNYPTSEWYCANGRRKDCEKE